MIISNSFVIHMNPFFVILVEMASFGMPMGKGGGGSVGATNNPVQNVMMNIIKQIIETNPEYLASGIPNDLIQKLMGTQQMYNNMKPMYSVRVISIFAYNKPMSI